MADWPTLHDKVVSAFAAGWNEPGPHAWDDLLALDVELAQPMLRHCHGRAAWQDEAKRLLSLVPDLRGEVVSWSGHEDTLFIHVRFTGTLGGAPLTWEAVDVARIDHEGKVLHRESFFDSVVPAGAVVRRPRAWLPWWRSGIAPLTGRRRMVGRPR